MTGDAIETMIIGIATVARRGIDGNRMEVVTTVLPMVILDLREIGSITMRGIGGPGTPGTNIRGDILADTIMGDTTRGTAICSLDFVILIMAVRAFTFPLDDNADADEDDAFSTAVVPDGPCLCACCG